MGKYSMNINDGRWVFTSPATATNINFTKFCCLIIYFILLKYTA